MKNKIIQGDCIEVMKEMEDNSIDTIITDPPYGLSFMGKKWDYDVPSIKIWKECLRVLKSGGTALIFAGSRTQHRMAVNIEDAGFVLKDCIMWLYGSGFPKATDISKQLDKGHKRKVVDVDKSKLRPNKENFAKRTDRQPNEKCVDGWKDNGATITEPTTPEAKLWNGWKSHGLKPAYEPIIVAMKPNEGTYAQNALKHGVSGLNIDGGRIGTDDKLVAGGKQVTNKAEERGGKALGMLKDGTENTFIQNSQGRFPANIILDEEAAKMLDEQSGSVGGDTRKSKSTYDKGIWGNAKPVESQALYNDKGGASRFFYVAKASKAERNLGCEGLEIKQKIFNGQSNRSSKDMKDVEERFTTQPSQNNHPTVKPLKLMEYLCILTKTPTGGIVLDPFTGSGTTLMAAINTDRDFIGIEKEPEYVKIAEARVKQTLKDKKDKDKQKPLL